MAWTKAKTAVVAGLGILAAAGTATVVTTKIVAKSKETASNAVFEEIWSHPNSSSLPLLAKTAPAFIIRPTRYPTLAGGCWNNGGQGFEVNIGLRELVGEAYEWSLERTVFPEQMPDGQYDLMESLPAGQNERALRAELKKQFGLVAHTETREADVLLLKVRDPAELQRHVSNGVRSENYMSGDNTTQYYHLKRRKLSELTHDLEGWIGAPLMDRTGMAGNYDFEFQWAAKLSGTGGFRQALRDQLEGFGLELVPDREPIEMLVVEKSNAAR